MEYQKTYDLLKALMSDSDIAELCEMTLLTIEGWQIDRANIDCEYLWELSEITDVAIPKDHPLYGVLIEDFVPFAIHFIKPTTVLRD